MVDNTTFAELFKAKTVVLMAACVVAWLLGVAQGYYSAESFSIFPAAFPAFLTALSVFAFSFLFFGFPAPIILFFVGAQAGETFAATPAITIPLIGGALAAFLAAYAAVRLGDVLLDDMMGKGNFKKAARTSLIVLLIGLIIAGFADAQLIG